MKIEPASVVLAMILVACGAPAARAALTYTTIDHPLAGAGGTVPYAVDGTRIVGTYFDSNRSSHGFLYDGTNWTTLDAPNASGAGGTAAYGVSDGTICGTYVTATGQTLGFLYDGVNWTTLDHPPAGLGQVDTFARGVSGSTVVGYYIQSLVARGFVYQNGTYTDLIVPGATGTFPRDVDGTRVVGAFEDLLGTHGFLTDGAIPIVLDHPLGLLLGTFANGVDGADVVGNYLSLDDGQSHGFLYDGTSYIPVDFPGATSTTANGIDGGRIVGSYVDAAGATHGFVAAVPEPAASAALLTLTAALTRRRRGAPPAVRPAR